MKIFTTKNLLLILVLIFIFFIIMTLLKSMNIYEGLDENKSDPEKKSESKSENKNIVVMANNG
jgi:hypothetical protein